MLHDFSTGVAGCFHRGVDAGFLACKQEVVRELGLSCRFASAESYSTAGTGEERRIGFYLTQYFTDCGWSATDAERSGITDFDALAAGGAGVTIEHCYLRNSVDGFFARCTFGRGQDECLFGAGCRAESAAVASFALVEQLGMDALGFGRMTPDTRERTAFQEYGGSDAGAVVGRELVDIEDESLNVEVGCEVGYSAVCAWHLM
jgi:hypothetical protein